MLKTVLSFGAALALLLSGGYNPSMTEINRVPAAIEALNATAAGQVDESTVYYVESYGELDIYTNRLHGYRISVPFGMTPDASLSPTRFKLSSGSRNIEIFKETFLNEDEVASYIDYSNRFARDTQSHRIEQDEWIVLNGRKARVIKWSRDSLAPGDRNHYANIDIVDGFDVYTITIKSAAEFNDHMAIASSFTLVQPDAPVGVMRPFDSQFNADKNEETAQAYERIFGEESGLNWGLFIPGQPGDGMALFEEFERNLGAKMDICLFYTFVMDEYNPALVYDSLVNAWESGKICEATIQLSPEVSGSMIYDILKGRYDSYIEAFAADVRRFGHPVLMRLFNEMNGDWCNYSAYYTSRDPDVYILLYKYVYNKFKEAGADNAIWVWNPNERSFPNFAWNSEELYYPGSEYVDVVGLTGYNTGTYYSGEKWRSFDRIYSGIYEKATLLYNKPLMLTEFSCAVIGGDKLLWVNDMFDSLPDYPGIKAAVWWSGSDIDYSTGNVARSYFINDTPGVMEAFHERLSE